jgi:hypothetical protein
MVLAGAQSCLFQMSDSHLQGFVGLAQQNNLLGPHQQLQP